MPRYRYEEILSWFEEAHTVRPFNNPSEYADLAWKIYEEGWTRLNTFRSLRGEPVPPDWTRDEFVPSLPSPVPNPKPPIPVPAPPPTGYDLPQADEWQFQGRALDRGREGWNTRFTGQITASSVVKWRGRYLLYYCAASGDRLDGGPANRAAGVAISLDGLRYLPYSDRPILTHQPHHNIEEGVFSAIVVAHGDHLFLFYGAILAADQTTPSVDVFVHLATSGDGLDWTDRGRVWGSAGHEAWPYAALSPASGAEQWYVWAGKKQPLKLLSGKPDRLTWSFTTASAHLPVNYPGVIGHSLVPLGGGRVGMFFDRPMRAAWASIESLTNWSDPITYPAIREGDVGKAVCLDRDRQLWFLYVLNPDGTGIDVYTAKAHRSD